MTILTILCLFFGFIASVLCVSSITLALIEGRGTDIFRFKKLGWMWLVILVTSVPLWDAIVFRKEVIQDTPVTLWENSEEGYWYFTKPNWSKSNPNLFWTFEGEFGKRYEGESVVLRSTVWQGVVFQIDYSTDVPTIIEGEE